MIRDANDPTFDATDMAGARLRARDTVLTTILWFVYAYLWLPLISLVAWFVGLDWAYERVLEAGGLEGLFEITRWYGIAVLIIMLFVIGWSAIQRLRFRGKERRGARPTVDAEELREEVGLPAEDFAILRRANIATVAFDEAGAMAGVRSLGSK